MNEDPDKPPEPPLAVLTASDRPVDLQWLRKALMAVLDHVDCRVRSLTVKVVDDEAMRVLHERHRGDPATTDVLTFNYNETGEPVEADIVVCADEAARRAAELDHPVERELLLYALHGVLHCAGFDDRTPDAFDAMHAEEDRILTAVGIGPTFRGSDA